MILHIKLIVFFLVLALTGCVGAPWQIINPNQTQYTLGKNIRVTLPAGWVEWVAPAKYERIELTRDGPSLQWITLEYRERERALTSLGTAWDGVPDVWRLAEWEQALSLRELDTPSARLISAQATQLRGKLAAKLVFSYQAPPGVAYRRWVYVQADEDGLLRIGLQAPVGHYFDAAIPDFEMVLRSLK
jgi:hypothetical protein